MTKTIEVLQGAPVVIKDSLLYNGRKGEIEDPIGPRHPEDFWDHNVRLDDGRLIGVFRSQIILKG